MKISLEVRGAADKMGRQPIYLRIADGSRRKYHKTKFRVKKTSFVNQQVQGDPETNRQLRTIVLAKETELLEGKRRYPDADFFEFAKGCIQIWDQEKKYNTVRNYNSELGKIREFKPRFRLSEITHHLLNEYKVFLATKKKNAPNTIWTSFKFFHLIVSTAISQKVIAEDPFEGYKMPVYSDPIIRYLFKAEVKQIEALLPEAGSLKFCLTWFLIGCYTGLRYSDMAAFNKAKHIRGGRLVLYTKKTGEVVSMPMSTKLTTLLKSINYQSMFISNQKFNAALKKIGEKTGLGTLTAHSSRHAFGIMCAESGISIEVCQRLMGHKSSKVTQIYYRIASPRSDKELEKLWK